MLQDTCFLKDMVESEAFLSKATTSDEQSIGRSPLDRLTIIDFHLNAGPELVKKVVDTNFIVKVVNFPLDKTVFAEFSKNLGPLMPKYKTTGISPEDYIGDVKIRTDIRPEDRLATERDGELKPHTAKSWGRERPRYFGLLMVDSGWIDQPSGMNGESIFVRTNDAVDEMQRLYPETFEEDFLLLKNTPVEFTATHLKDQVARMPLLFPISKNGTLGLRYKENMRTVIERIAPPTQEGKRYIQAVDRFDKSLQTAPHIETQLNSGDLIILDNRTVAHARNTFLSERVDSNGKNITNPRHLYNIHMHPDTYDSKKIRP